jgi:hypothetical protein
MYETSPLDEDLLDCALTPHQLALLRTIQKLLENMLLGGGSQEAVFDDSMFLDDVEGQRRNSLSVAINRGLTNMLGLNGASPDPSQRFSILGCLISCSLLKVS